MKNCLLIDSIIYKFSWRVFLTLCCFINSNALAQSTIQMKKEGGVYSVPCTVNGLPLSFIFDTGASDVTISKTEAVFMFKNGFLKDEDFIGTEYYQTANGTISEGVKFILREIKFGNVKLVNVIASVVLSDNAPLLLGQSVLARIGRYQIDAINDMLFITPQKSNTTLTTVTDIEGNVYPITKIGNQTWMAENLKVSKYNNGEPIPKTTDSDDWSTSKYGAYCFYDNESNKRAEYGALYNWEAVIDSRGICPYGWHVPERTEYATLNNYMNTVNLKSGALKALKLWQQPNDSAKNYNRFSALPGGKRWNDSGKFEFIKTAGFYWTSSSFDAKSAYYYAFSFDYSVARLAHFNRNDGFSCRCLKD